MYLTLEKTKNNTVILDYCTNNDGLDIGNRIFQEREKELNKISPEVVLEALHQGISIVDRFDRETNKIINKRVYNSQDLYLRGLLAELKGLSPLYNQYTIITYNFSGKYYSEDNGLIFCNFDSNEEIEFNNDNYCAGLIGQPFTKLFEYLSTTYKNNHFNFAVMKFNVELLPNNHKLKSKRRKTNIPRGMRHEVFKRDNYTCVECGATKEDGAILHIDHIIPVSKGGTDELTNLQTLCADCNLNKSNIIQRMESN